MAITADVVVTKLQADVATHDAKIANSARQFEQRMQQMSRAAERAGRATSLVGVSPAFDKFASGAEVATQSTKKLNTAINGSLSPVGNLAAQFNDIGVQLAGGQSPFLIALQQGSQINQVIGQQGAAGAVKLLGSAFASLINPVSIATIGIIGFGGMAVQYLTDALTATDETSKSIDEMNKIIINAAKVYGDATPALQAFAEELERIQASEEVAGGLQTALNKTFADLAAGIASSREEMRALLPSMSELAQNDAGVEKLRASFKEFNIAIKEAEQAARDNKDPTEALGRAMAAMADIMSNDVVSGSAAMNSSLSDVITTLQDATDAASALNKEMEQVLAKQNARKGTEGRIQDPLETLKIETVFGDRFEGTPYEDPKKNRGGGSRDRQAAQIERERQAVVDLIDAMEFEQSLIGLSNVEREKMINLRKAGAQATPEQRARIEELTQTIYTETEALKQQEQAYNQLQQIGEQAISGIANAFSDGKITAEEMIGVVGRLIQQLLTMQQIGGGSGGGILGLIGGVLGIGGGGGGDPWAGLRSVGVQTFARGGVTDRPAIFGEAGTEAAVPLPDGRSIPVNLRMPDSQQAGSNAGQLQINVNVEGANGDQHVIDLVNQGVSKGLQIFPTTRHFKAGVQGAVIEKQKTNGFGRGR